MGKKSKRQLQTEYHRRWRLIPENQEKQNRQEAKRRWKAKMEVLLAYSSNGVPSCVQCGETDVRVLQIDHIIPRCVTHPEEKISVGGGLYKRLKKEGFPSGYQILCANCNHRKRYIDEGLYYPLEEVEE